jgi:hypothetical protein
MTFWTHLARSGMLALTLAGLAEGATRRGRNHAETAV